MKELVNKAMEREYTLDGGISAEVVNRTKYQTELKKLQAHYGIRATLDSHYQAEWDKEGAYARLSPCNDLWLRVESTKDIIGAEFATQIHLLLADDKTAEEIIANLGSFEHYLKDILDDKMFGLIWDRKIISVLKKTKRRWWFEY